VTAVVLDTHVIHWWSAEPERLSKPAAKTINEATELAVSAVSWFELAWLAKHERIEVTIPIRSWLDRLAAEVLTIGITPAIADTAVSLPSSFPGDPADRLIYASAIEHGSRLVTKDRRMRATQLGHSVAVW
jgi:PIN domain nuclease of toxin-antitoxin system